MNKTVVGMDSSQAYFDVSWRRDEGREEQHRQAQDAAGYAALWSAAPSGSVQVMEATGVSYLALAHSLYAHGQEVAVVNPLVVRRQGQMKLLRAKTAAADARLIADYGREERPRLWPPAPKVVGEMCPLESGWESLTPAPTRLINQQATLVQRPDADSFVPAAQLRWPDRVRAEREACERQLQHLAETHFGERYRRLVSIPGIGPKTAVKLIAVTEGFTRFATVAALVSYLGWCPRGFESGSSVRGKRPIATLGRGRLRQLLSLCSWTARRCNAACRAVYERLQAKGTPERVIKIAIAHTLVRQAFAVAMKKEMYADTWG